LGEVVFEFEFLDCDVVFERDSFKGILGLDFVDEFFIGFGLSFRLVLVIDV
jgi:hypothetical protein